MNDTTIRACPPRQPIVFHRGSLRELAAFTGRVILRATVIVVPFLIAVAAFNSTEPGFETVVVALLILLYCGIRAVGITIVTRTELAMLGAQQVATALARRSSRFDLAPFTSALQRLRADHAKSQVQAAVECASLAILSYSAIRAIFGLE